MGNVDGLGCSLGMTLLLLLVLSAVVVIMTINGRGQVPWSKNMRRVHAGVARRAEWMATDEVVQQVKADYLEAVRWMHDHMLTDIRHSYQAASMYMLGSYLQQFRARIAADITQRHVRFVGVLRADHHIIVRHFTENGESCLIIDQQTQRRMATYRASTHERLMTQDMGECALVYRMTYDLEAGRWKIADFVQELPVGWNKRRTAPRIREMSILPGIIGRDH